ncbi:SAM-dependent methyltransferase [Parasphingorhabdus pacifica]
MAPSEWIPHDVDIERPSAARIYDYYLGGGNNFASDRELAKKVLAAAPEIRTAALANRDFLQRVVRYCISRGITQFLDIGSGIPTVGNTHEVAQQIDPECRVVYVDNEPVAVAHSELMLSDIPNTATVQCDARDVKGVLDAEATRNLLDFDKPVAIFMLALLHFIPDSEVPGDMLESYRAAVAPGSVFALSHVTGDELPEEMNTVVDLYEQSQNPGTLRNRAEFRALVGGFEVVEPGVVFLPDWRPDRERDTDPERSVCYGLVAHVM